MRNLCRVKCPNKFREVVKCKGTPITFQSSIPVTNVVTCCGKSVIPPNPVTKCCPKGTNYPETLNVEVTPGNSSTCEAFFLQLTMQYSGNQQWIGETGITGPPLIKFQLSLECKNGKWILTYEARKENGNKLCSYGMGDANFNCESFAGHGEIAMYSAAQGAPEPGCPSCPHGNGSEKLKVIISP